MLNNVHATLVMLLYFCFGLVTMVISCVREVVDFSDIMNGYCEWNCH